MNSRACQIHVVMPGLVPGIPVFLLARQDVNGRDEPGHDEAERIVV
ncbi:MAG TPA: hypothetical protein VKR55_19475 [Bradyrhizobium sp.]|nr:hypothetical protein [Bradyrhizobium sp.]HLZ04314.1 hypothetical protein [Bradyrhizobium sp.]